jgi:hypothetical protein
MSNKTIRRLGVLLALLLPAGAVAADQKPSAGFSFSPESPRTGDQVRFVSSSCDPDGRLDSELWDLDGDGAFDDAEGPVAARSFAGAGGHLVGLRVTARDGSVATLRRRVMVDTQYALPRPDSARLMSPFPVVTLGGRLTRSGVRVRLLSVRAPVCSTVLIRCRGRGCPLRRVSAYVGRRPLRLKRAQRRYRAGTVLTVAVTRGDRIGKITTFRMRKGKAPRREDECLRPGESAGSRCPRD